MASIKPHKDGWRAQVKTCGVRDSGIFRTKRQAQEWAAARETEIRQRNSMPAGDLHTMRDAMLRYQSEVSPSKRGSRFEELRINAMLDMPLPLDKPIGKIEPDDFNPWRQARLRKVKPGTVLRELAILSAIFETARREWRWITSNPIADVRRPNAPDHRERVIQRHEIRGMLRVLGHTGKPPRSITQAVAVCFLVALRTGMRAGELCGLKWEDVRADYCRLHVTKTKPRDVPLSPKARRTLELMRGFDRVLVFGMDKRTLDALFRRARKNAGLDGFTFHDSRHTAATWLAQSLHVLDLCKMFGWGNPKRAMTYYNPTAADIAKRIGKGQGHPEKTALRQF